MKDQVCTQEQMQTLIDRGVDVSGASYKIIDPNTNPLLSRIDMIPVFTTADLMEMLPFGWVNNPELCERRYVLEIYKVRGEWCIVYNPQGSSDIHTRDKSLITALYDIIIWLLDNGHKLNQ